MGWNNFSGEEKELTNQVSDTPLTYPLLGDNLIEGECHKVIIYQGVSKEIVRSAEKAIKILAPNLETNDGCFIRTNDNKFIDVREGD